MPEGVHTRFGEDGAPPADAQLKHQAKSAARVASHPTPNLSNGKSHPAVHAGSKRKYGLDRSKPDQHRAAKPERPQGELKRKSEALLPSRRALPVWPHAEQIRNELRSNSVLLLAGETGSGKSTQVPQFLVHQPWCKGCIAVTQPRRVAAISLARRVADEMGTPLGSASPASKVGYSVRFDHSASPSTRIMYLTEGMLLQEMLRDPSLSQYSAVIVDEVHERSVNVDLLLGFLRQLLSQGKHRRKDPLKVVVMSATADVEKLESFFGEKHAQALSMASTKEEETDAVDSEASWSGFSDSDDKAPATSANLRAPEESDSKPPLISKCHIKGRQYPVQIMYLPEPTRDFVEAALKSVFQINYKEPLPGDILVFLTGQDTVESLDRLIKEYAEQLGPDVPKIVTRPLFAALPQSEQQKVFQPAPYKTRKVILSTNIAETSVTVPGVRFVVDSGKAKVKQFHSRLGLDSLLVKPVSQSSAIQREGRAGREAPGKCYRLYTEKSYVELQRDTTPEILRCDLSSALLGMKARGVQDVIGFPLLDRPSIEAMEKGLLQLYQLEALTDEGLISDTGIQMARLPLTPMLGRIIVEAARPERDCLADVIDIISGLSVENLFLNLVTEEKKEEAEIARRELYRREGDHLTLLTTVQAYAEEQSDRKKWAEKHFVSHRAMQNVMNIRKQLLSQCKQMNLLSSSTNVIHPVQSEARKNAILLSLLRGFCANTARLMPDGCYKTLLSNQTVAIHPSSVLFGRKAEAIMFSEFVFTNRSYARDVSAVRLDWVGEVLAA